MSIQMKLFRFLIVVGPLATIRLFRYIFNIHLFGLNCCGILNYYNLTDKYGNVQF